MHHLRMIRTFFKASLQQELAYRANFYVQLLHALLNLATGVLALWVLFEQVQSVRGWTFDATLAVLGVYLTVGALRNLFIGPSLDALTGMDGEVWDGRFDFTLLRPVDAQFLASVGRWRPFAFFELLLGLGVLGAAIVRLGGAFNVANLLQFLLALSAAVLILYAILLVFSGLVFWSPGFLFGWVFNGIFQLARYPVGLYPGALRLVLTWLVPVGLITTVPAEALSGELAAGQLVASLVFAILLTVAASVLFRSGLRRYASASS